MNATATVRFSRKPSSHSHPGCHIGGRTPLTQRAPSIPHLPPPPPAHTYTHTHTRIHTLDLLPHGAPALFHALYTSASMVVDGMLPFTWPKGQKKKGSYKRFVADIADTHVVLWGCC